MSPLSLKTYPIHAFPVVAREAIKELQSNIQAPLSLIGTSVLTAMSAAAQSRIRVRLPIGGQPRPVVVWAVVIGDSGERKSPVDERVVAPLKRRDEVREAQYKQMQPIYKVEHRLWKKIETDLIKKIAKLTLEGESTDQLRASLFEHCKDEPSVPRLRKLLRQNISARSLLDDLNGRGESLAIMSEEGQVVLESPLLRSSGLLNKGWDGGPIMWNRGNGVSISAQDIRLTISIMAQSSVIQDHLRNQGDTSRGTGFFARFLFTWPESTKGTRFAYNIEPTWERLKNLHTLLEDMMGDIDKDGGDAEQIVYELDDDARAYWFDLVNQIEVMIQPWGYMNDISDFASKACEITVRIAALFHHLGKQPGKITRDSLQRAADIVDFHIHEFKRIFSTQYAIPPIYADATTLEGYLRTLYQRGGGMPIPRNPVLKSGPVRPNDRFGPALQMLEAAKKVSVSTDANRRAWIYFNPQYFGPLPQVV